MAATNPPLLALAPEETFVDRRAEIDRIYQLGLEAASARRRSTLVVGRRGVGKSEILRRAYNRLFWNQSRVTPLCLTLTKETSDAVAFARQWLATFLRQVVGFRRRDAGLINDEAMPFGRAVRLAAEANDPWLMQLVRNFEESLRDGDWVSLLRNSVAAPLLTVRNTGAPVFTIVDEFQRIGMLTSAGEPVSLAGQFEFILQSSEAPHLLAGSSLRVIERLLGSRILGRHIERLRIDPMSERLAVRFVERLCRQLEVGHDPRLGIEMAEQLEGVAMYVQAIVRAAAAQGVALTSLRNVQMVYAQDLLCGEIGAAWSALFEEAVPVVAERRPALELLSHLTEDVDLRPVPWENLARRFGMEEMELQRLAEQLERGGFLEIGHSQIVPLADRVLRDWVRLAHRREQTSDTGVLRQALVRERLVWATKARQERTQRLLGRKLEALLTQWDCQTVQPILFDWPRFQRAHGSQVFQDAMDAVSLQGATLRLPQIVGLSEGDAPPQMPTLMAYGFEEGRYAAGQESLLVAGLSPGPGPVTATQAEAFLEMVTRLASPLGFEHQRGWLIARGGFTPEACEALAQAGCWTSDHTQLQILMRQFGVRTEQLASPGTLSMTEALTAGEYALMIPMEADTELVAASAIEQIASQAGFAEAARGQIKMAVIEACINAREHGGLPGAVTLLIRPADTHLEIVIENPGAVFDASAITQPVLEEKLGRDKSLRDKRGWGLELMRKMMDEVIFEPAEDGMRVRLIKYRTPRAQTPQAPVLDLPRE